MISKLASLPEWPHLSGQRLVRPMQRWSLTPMNFATVEWEERSSRFSGAGSFRMPSCFGAVCKDSALVSPSMGCPLFRSRLDSSDFAANVSSGFVLRFLSNVALSSSDCASAAKASADEPAVASVGGDALWVLVALGEPAIAGASGTIADELFFLDVFSSSDR